ncbi:uncharacterized protein [Diadema setosum]|uniref:uncharacterized protein n=1 Tax=Diadema setosum TaxID=31175 RepID=UPI003B3B0691
MSFPEMLEYIHMLEDDTGPNEECSLLEEGLLPFYGTSSDKATKSVGPTRSSINDRSFDDDVPRKWPPAIRVVLCALGLWFSGQPSTTPSTTTLSRKHLDVSTENDTVTNNGVTRSSFLKSDDQYGSVTNSAAPLRSKAGLWSDILAFAYLFLTCGLLGYDMFSYFQAFWGLKSDLLHLVSYLTFLFQVTAIPVWCLYARIRYRKVNHGTTRCYPMNQAYVARRVLMLSKCRSGKKALSCLRLALFMFWPLFNATLRLIYDYVYQKCVFPVYQKELGHWAAVLGYLFYGSFCYLIYLERVSFEAEILYLTRFAKTQAPEQNVRNVRAKIRQFYEHYDLLREQIDAWMAFTMVVATWGLTAHVTWNYLIYTYLDNNKPHSKALIENIRFLNILVSCQKIMFFVLPWVALGGLNLEHVWRNLKVTIVKYRDSRFESFWMIVHRYVVDINAGWHREIMPTLIFSAIGFYLGLKLGKGDQHTNFWDGPIPQCANMTT